MYGNKIIFGKNVRINDNVFLHASNGIEIEGEGAIVSGTNVTITKTGSHLVTGSSNEGNIIIDTSSVNLFLQNLELSSSKTSPIIVTSKLSDIKIISIENVILKD